VREARRKEVTVLCTI